MTAQLRKKGSAAFNVIGERLVLSSNADLAFTNGAEKMLKEKELKSQKKQVDKIEADWSKAHIMKAKMSLIQRLTFLHKSNQKTSSLRSVLEMEGSTTTTDL